MKENDLSMHRRIAGLLDSMAKSSSQYNEAEKKILQVLNFYMRAKEEKRNPLFIPWDKKEGFREGVSSFVLYDAFMDADDWGDAFPLDCWDTCGVFGDYLGISDCGDKFVILSQIALAIAQCGAGFSDLEALYRRIAGDISEWVRFGWDPDVHEGEAEEGEDVNRRFFYGGIYLYDYLFEKIPDSLFYEAGERVDTDYIEECLDALMDYFGPTQKDGFCVGRVSSSLERVFLNTIVYAIAGLGEEHFSCWRSDSAYEYMCQRKSLSKKDRTLMDSLFYHMTGVPAKVATRWVKGSSKSDPISIYSFDGRVYQVGLHGTSFYGMGAAINGKEVFTPAERIACSVFHSAWREISGKEEIKECPPEKKVG